MQTLFTNVTSKGEPKIQQSYEIEHDLRGIL